MDDSYQLVVFLLDDRQYALQHLASVEKIVRAVQVTPLPKAPEIVIGAINLQGQIIPVVNIRQRFRLTEREANLADRFIIARTPKRTLAFFADAVTGVLELPHDALIAKERVIPGLEYISGVAKLADGMILIHDLDSFLSLEEEATLETALKQHGRDQ
jgi:purine-binding chemotaxis protein CheW